MGFELRKLARAKRLAAAMVVGLALASSVIVGVDRARAQIPIKPEDLPNYIAFCAGVYLWQTGENSPETQKAIDMVMELKKVDRRAAINLTYDARDERLINQLQGHDDAADVSYAKDKLVNCQAWTGILIPPGDIRVLPKPWSRPLRTVAELDAEKVRNCAGMYTLQDPDSASAKSAIALSAEVTGISLDEAKIAAERKAKGWQDLRASGQAKPVEVSNMIRRCSYWIDIPVPEGAAPFGEYPTRDCDDRCKATRDYIAAVHVAAEAGRAVECMDAEVAAAKIMDPYYARGAEAISRYDNTQVCIGGECYGGGDASLGIETRSAMCKAFNRAIGVIPSQCVDEYKQIRDERDNLKCR